MTDGDQEMQHEAVRSVGSVPPTILESGRLSWLVGAKQTPGAEQTLGVVTIDPGKRNPLHLHPNCEELLYVMEGAADHKLGDEIVHIRAGDVIVIPRGVPHWARATGDGPLVAVQPSSVDGVFVVRFCDREIKRLDLRRPS